MECHVHEYSIHFPLFLRCYVFVSMHSYNIYRPSASSEPEEYMDYLIENEEIIYLHKIKEGASGLSLTHLAAKTAGLSEEALKRSLEILQGGSPLEANHKLKITKTMAKEILYMKKIFKLALKKEEKKREGS